MGKLIYISGFSGSGKTTIAKELQKLIPNSILLDGDEIRFSINKDLGFTKEEKIENIRRNNAMIELLANQNVTIICAFMASISEERDKLFDKGLNITKVQLTTPIEVCIDRDVKGLYKNNTKNFAGLTSVYTPLPNTDLDIDTSKQNLNECVELILDKVNKNT